MSDKSFGDHPNRNIVKNPLLSSAVTGLSLEDLTHKAVLLPVTPSLDQIIRSDQQQGSQAPTLAHPKHESSIYPSGDAFSNISLSTSPQSTKQNLLDSKKNVNLENRNTLIATQSKASVKSDDDFDVNEYIARLQGTRYVSAPLHSHLKEDKNVNLEATEENLEEINLNETIPAETQQSLTADIAQNFSQLPTVLPHVASAVFSSFSNMLSYKSREQTPDQRETDQGNKGGYDEVQLQRPEMGVEEFKTPKEVAPPPKEPSIAGTSNFRITSKKKYAQIPGLSTGDAAQTMTYPPVQNPSPFGHNLPPVGLNMPPIGQNMPSVGQHMPPFGQNMQHVGQRMPSIGQNMPNVGQHMPPVGQNMPPIGHNIPLGSHNMPLAGLNMPPVGQNVQSVAQNIPPIGHNAPPIGQFMPQTGQDVPQLQESFTQHPQHDQNSSSFDQSIPSAAQNVPFASQSMSKIGLSMAVGQSGTNFIQPPVGQKDSYLNPNKVEETPKTLDGEIIIQEATRNTQPVAEKQSTYNIFNPASENTQTQRPGANQPNLLTGSQNFFTPVEQNIPSSTGTAAIIPPPPMFSNIPRRDSQPSVVKSVLPPSVARRISANQSIIKPTVSAPTFTENIFVPEPVLDVSEIGKPDSNFSSGISSAFVPAFTSSKSDQIGSLSSQNVLSNITPPNLSATPATIFCPLTEAKPHSSFDSSAFFTPKETASLADIPLSSVPTTASTNLPPYMPASTFPSTPGATASSVPSSASMNMPTSSIFTPDSIKKPENAPPSVYQLLPQNVLPPTFFTPQQVEYSSNSAPHPITQIPPMAAPEPPKPVPEPPKATGNVNFRMTKKRPQYYAGPIEGVGAISNNFKPIIAPVLPSSNPVETSNFQGALFTPDQTIQPAVEQYASSNIEQASVPFDISRPQEQASIQSAFDISRPQEYSYGTSFDMQQPESQNYQHEYNTPFDMSRKQIDSYNQTKQESKGFGIIGSLKSKLSSIDINKIQSTVTTFFDPAYNDTKVAEPIQHDNMPYQPQQQLGQMPQGQSNFDIFVPNVEQSQYSQFAHGFDYSQYSQTQDSHWQNQEQTQNVPSYSTSSYFTDTSYSTEQVYSQNPLYDNTQTSNQIASSYNRQINVPDKVEANMTSKTDISPFQDPNTLTHENVTRTPIQHPNYDISYQNKDQIVSVNAPETHPQNVNIEPHAETNINTSKQKSSTVIGSEEASNMTFNNPDAFAYENRQIWEPQQPHDNLSIFAQPHDQYQKNIMSAFTTQTQEPVFYNPNAFENQQVPKSHQQLFEKSTQDSTDNQKDFVSNVCKTVSPNRFQTDSQPSCDLALNTSKYNMVSTESQTVEQKVPTNAPLLPAASFFDSPPSTNIPLYPKDNENHYKSTQAVTTDTKTEDLHKAQKYSEISKSLSYIPTSIGTKSQEDLTKAGGDNKYIEQEQQRKEGNLIESLSKDDIPVLGVSTVPLFGLSAIIPDKSKDVSDLESRLSFNIHQTKSLFGADSASSFFENKEPENKIISENQVKKLPLDITALNINDVKNVLVIEPPQENIGSLLKRNASSSKLENLPEKSLEHHMQQSGIFSDIFSNTTFQEDLKIPDGNTPNPFFSHPKEIEERDSQEVVSVLDENSELNICETCREVNTPEHEWKHKETEDLTTQLIENITSKLQLSNPLTVPFKEPDPNVVERSLLVDQQLEEITQVAEETFETLQVQSATELLDKRTTSEIRDYGWVTEEIVQPASPHEDHDYASKFDSKAIVTSHDLSPLSNPVPAANLAQEYDFKLDPNSIGFFGNNSLFFDNLPVPTNASDEIKAEIKHSHEDIILPRQMSIPTAPPEDELKLDEIGIIDVHSIEQDAKKDFPLEEEFIIEPSVDEFLSTDDDKIELRERKRSSEDSSSNDTFTNRVERFKKYNDNPDDDAFEQKPYGSPPISMASYFDTGNYAVESHFRNSLVNMRIPPGFEEEYARKLSGVSVGSAEGTSEPYIPDTSTQTRPINTPTYSSPYDGKENTVCTEMGRKENAETLGHAFVESKAETTTVQTTEHPTPVTQITSVFTDTSSQPNALAQNVQPLTDPMNFFSSDVEEPKVDEPATTESFNRLASYFSMPPAQPEHSKSFFELSQSQNHYRHEPKTQNNQKPFFELSQSQNHYIDDDTKNNIKELMKDLTSPQNIIDHTVKTVNYFTVELDNDINCKTNITPINIKLDELNKNKTVNIENSETKPVENYSKDIDSDDILKCEHCRRYVSGINSKAFIVKTAVNEPTQPNSGAEMSSQNDSNKLKTSNTVNFDFDVEKQSENSVTVTLEHRGVSDYTPVKHHWFYRVDVDEKSVWRGFSTTDSTALEEAYQSPDLNENTLVPTDGGRYDVNVVGRLRIAVYWKEKPTNVRRCSWFYKGTTDARYVPYTEPVAEKLEEEYRHGVTTGEWHRKLVLPNSEMVIMHGPSVMVHFLHSTTTDAFSTPPQAAARPRVVRRSHEESEIEESEPSKIDHLLLLCHGVGSACDMRFRSVEEVVEDFRTTSLQLLQSHYRNSYDNGLVSRVEVLPISWHEQLHAGESGVDRRLARVTLDSIPRLRAFTNHTVLDVLFYTSPVFHQTIIDTVCSEMNRVYSMFRERNPHFSGHVSLGGHSLGSVILYDLLCHQSPESPLQMSKSPSEKRYVTGTTSTGQPVKYPQLCFPPAALYALGSPIAIFECIRGVDSLGMEFALPTCKNFFNIFHPYDPIAYRIEPLINPLLQEVKPSQIPHHKGRKRMHLELKDTMARVGADLKQKLIESLRTTWNKWKSTPPPDGQLEKVVEEEIEKEQLANEEDQASEMQATAEMLGRLNGGRRVDYVLQEAPLEMINEYLFAMSSHVGYWESEDTMLLMLREIYDSLGVQPDSTVPQQSMTLQRTKPVAQDETSKLLSEPDIPSTSRGGT